MRWNHKAIAGLNNLIGIRGSSSFHTGKWRRDTLTLRGDLPAGVDPAPRSGSQLDNVGCHASRWPSETPGPRRADAPVTLVEFSDYQCPICRQFFDATFPALKKEYMGKCATPSATSIRSIRWREKPPKPPGAPVTRA